VLVSVGASWAEVNTLSGGERSRLLFVGLTLARYSLLMLDEPTNHLDMEGKEALATPCNSLRAAYCWLATTDS
jgi:ATPase subunit of ABC transporter with duplicated ATPase domains